MIWPALASARAAGAVPRCAFRIDGVTVGSVARADLPALAAWPQALRLSDDAVEFITPAAQRDDVLNEIHADLRRQGLIRAWRDERFPLFDPHTLAPLARIERAATRFWGTLTLGAHCTGYVRGLTGEVQALWIAQRSFTKATDPGCHDNLVGGGVPAGQGPWEALVREGFEEAGLPAERMRTATPGSVIRLDRGIPEGHQLEDLYSWDLELPAGLTPENQDGEVHAFTLLPVAEALALASSGRMTVDAELVTLDFACRHALLPAQAAAHLAGELQRLFAPRGHVDQKT